MTSKGYNGHRNWNAWNVSLWINNDETLYRIALDAIRRNRTRREAAQDMFLCLYQANNSRHPKTPDGAPYSVTTIQAAMVGFEK